MEILKDGEIQALEVIKVSRSEEEFLEYCKTRALTILLENSWNAETEAAFLLNQAIGGKVKIPETELEDKIKRLERKLEKVNGLTVKDLKEFGISEDLEDNKILQSIIDNLEMYVPADNVESRGKERMLLDSPVIAENGHLSKKRLKVNIGVVKNRVSGAWFALETVGNKLASKYKDNELEGEIEAIREQLTEVNASLYKITCGWDELMTWERYGRFMGRKIRENQKNKEQRRIEKWGKIDQGQ